jgi:hypothetical protein
MPNSPGYVLFKVRYLHGFPKLEYLSKEYSGIDEYDAIKIFNTDFEQLLITHKLQSVKWVSTVIAQRISRPMSAIDNTVADAIRDVNDRILELLGVEVIRSDNPIKAGKGWSLKDYGMGPHYYSPAHAGYDHTPTNYSTYVSPREEAWDKFSNYVKEAKRALAESIV